MRQLTAMGHEVTLFHRGKTIAELPIDVHEILGDRTHLLEFKSKFEEISPQVVLDMIPYTEEDALGVMKTFTGIARACCCYQQHRCLSCLRGDFGQRIRSGSSSAYRRFASPSAAFSFPRNAH
ncbi:MAG: hypothetical protein DSM106950_32245 [Stigonema ocellatum SAG 48.90 = DSM 106950]|nr:hypothetical protein [Stigonema ocellatum SAG 48.90 = DSM 106950]